MRRLLAGLLLAGAMVLLAAPAHAEVRKGCVMVVNKSETKTYVVTLPRDSSATWTIGPESTGILTRNGYVVMSDKDSTIEVELKGGGKGTFTLGGNVQGITWEADEARVLEYYRGFPSVIDQHANPLVNATYEKFPDCKQGNGVWVVRL